MFINTNPPHAPYSRRRVLIERNTIAHTCCTVHCTLVQTGRGQARAMRQLVLVAVLIVSAGACPPCDTTSCPKDPERDCKLGPAPDPCECCSLGICGLEEGQPCYNATIYKKLPEKRRLGSCASNMECVLRNDLEPSDGLETECVCAERRVACGSDNTTYQSTCSMHLVKNNIRITLQHWGPCHQEPVVTTGPEGGVKVLMQPIILACEAKGFPVPSVMWEFVSLDGTHVILPGDDHTISVQIRGGPESMMVSSWAQIPQARKSDAGTYSCIANNDSGSARAVATIIIKS